MQYGICNLGIVPIRLEPSDTSEMVTQALYGDRFKVLEKRKNWSRIRFSFDKYEGWIDNKQYKEIEEFDYKGLSNSDMKLSKDLIEFVSDASNNLYLIPVGSDLNGLALKKLIVYKLNGYKLFRDASEQASQGEALSFIEESEPGDLAFFDNAEGNIIHVGIIMEDNHIIHAHGKVRIDRLDHSGIYNIDKNMHTHKLRVIKKII